MAITAMSGPVVTFGQGPSPDNNAQRGPCVLDQFAMLADPRPVFAYSPGQSATSPIAGWMSSGCYCTIDAAPATIADNNISASASPGAGAITLVSVTGAGITAGASVVRADTGATVTGLLAIDGAMTRLGFGSDASVQAWDPTKAVARNVRITSGGNDTGITFTVSGYDVYGQPMTETITGVSGGVASGKKAFKYISGVTHTGSVATTLKIGTGDVYGLPLRCDTWGYAEITWNAITNITAATGFVVPDATSPATAVTGDTRGTYAVQGAASNGTLRLTVFQRVSPANVSSTAGLLGVTQV